MQAYPPHLISIWPILLLFSFVTFSKTKHGGPATPGHVCIVIGYLKGASQNLACHVKISSLYLNVLLGYASTAAGKVSLCDRIQF